MTNDEYLKELASRGDCSLQAWFDAEHVDNTRSAKRAAAAERVRKAKDAGTSIGYAIVGREYYPWEAYETLIELLTDDDGLRNNDGVAAEHGATRMTNLERLFIDSEQFRQAVSAFAFAHSDECPTSPTQMVDWLMAPYVDAHSKPHSKTEQMLTEQSESLSDDLGHPTDMSQKSADCVRNDWKMSETGVSANDVDANDENATCNNSGDFVTDDSREKIEADITSIIRNAAIWARQKIERGEGSLFMLDKYDPMIRELLDRQAEITRKTEQAAWIQQANGLIHEANVERDELQDTVESLKAERDALAADLQDCEQQRERLRQALGIALDHAHDICSLVDIDGNVLDVGD